MCGFCLVAIVLREVCRSGNQDEVKTDSGRKASLTAQMNRICPPRKRMTVPNAGDYAAYAQPLGAVFLPMFRHHPKRQLSFFISPFLAQLGPVLAPHVCL